MQLPKAIEEIRNGAPEHLRGWVDNLILNHVSLSDIQRRLADKVRLESSIPGIDAMSDEELSELLVRSVQS